MDYKNDQVPSYSGPGPLRFIGPRSENRPFMAEVLGLILNDHVFWRRNFHPQDPAVLRFSQLKNGENTEFQEGLVNELFNLMAELKFDPPFFSPRYMAHMISEPLLPGLIAYIATLFYNPNNVASEASTVTRIYEQKVGEQLATMFGYDKTQAFGHLTGGGTVANYQSLYYNLNLKFLPLSLFFALNDKGFDPEECGLPKDLKLLCNKPYEDYFQMLRSFESMAERTGLNQSERRAFFFGKLGWRGMDKQAYKIFGRPLPDPRIIVPASAHYSWTRGAKLIGLGSDSLIKIKMNSSFEMDRKELKQTFGDIAKSEDTCVLQTSTVFGTTEAGSFDPINLVVEERNKLANKGIFTPIHVDAAYGGYYSSLFQGDAPKTNEENLKALEKKHRALRECESITVDPHKLGYAPYGAGAFLFKHGGLKEVVAEEAKYCFSPKGMEDVEQLGKYILEGSKPGAAAAAVYFNHKLVPLNFKGYGRMLTNLSETAKEFADKLAKASESPAYEIRMLAEPQANIICFFLVPNNNNKVSRANLLTSKIAARFGIKDVKSVQEYNYIVSNTTLSLQSFASAPSCLDGLEEDAEELNLIRMVFMNQWHRQKIEGEKNHLDLFLEQLCSAANEITSNV